MKYFAFILSVYVLVLTAIPCVDLPKDDNLHKTELTNSATEHHEHTTDQCSPFCVCVCCATPIINNSTIHFTCTPIAKKILTEYNKSFVSSPFVTIWQPPKLS